MEPAKQKISDIAQRLRSEGGGLISIFYHPCEWVHREFWDGVNFSRGANPPREKWKAPGQRTAEETDAAFKRFAEYIDYIRALSGVKWVTAGDLPGLYPDLAHAQGATESDLDELAKRTSRGRPDGVDYQGIGPKIYSVADQFELLSRALNQVLSGQTVSFPLKTEGLMGPDAPPPSPTLTNLNPLALRDALPGVVAFIQREHRVPARVFIGADPIPPADFLVAMAAEWDLHRTHPEMLPETTVSLGQATRVLPERHVAKDTPELFGGWIIHRAGFRAPKVMELARLQAWSLKPATGK
jgi:hypothetical protein